MMPSEIRLGGRQSRALPGSHGTSRSDARWAGASIGRGKCGMGGVLKLILLGRDALHALEQADKVRIIVEAAFERDLRDGQLRGGQQRGGLFDAVMHQVFNRGLPEDFLEDPAEVVRVHAGPIGQIVQ